MVELFLFLLCQRIGRVNFLGSCFVEFVFLSLNTLRQITFHFPHKRAKLDPISGCSENKKIKQCNFSILIFQCVEFSSVF